MDENQLDEIIWSMWCEGLSLQQVSKIIKKGRTYTISRLDRLERVKPRLILERYITTAENCWIKSRLKDEWTISQIATRLRVDDSAVKRIIVTKGWNTKAFNDEMQRERIRERQRSQGLDVAMISVILERGRDFAGRISDEKRAEYLARLPVKLKNNFEFGNFSRQDQKSVA